MQTNFTAEQLRDPDTASSNAVLRTCVHCGFCTATCPTFLLLGDELDSPAWPHLPDQGHAGNRPARDRGGRAARRSLPVLPVMHDHLPLGRELHASGRSRANLYRADLPAPAAGAAAARSLLGVLLPRPGLFRLALKGAGLARPLAGMIPGKSMLAQRMRAMLSLAPAAVPPASPTERPRFTPPRGSAARQGSRCWPAAPSRY